MSQGIVTLPLAVLRALRRLQLSDLVYINTSVIIDYQLAARLVPGKALLHIHEIPSGPIKLVLRGLARWSRAEIIFNSRATKAAFAPVGDNASHVIYNGVSAPQAAETTDYDGSRPLKLLLLGRINRVKGQEILVAAIASLPEGVRTRLRVRMVGGAFENPEAEKALASLIEEAGLDAQVSMEPFAADTAPLYRWADVVVTPSKLPESLGRVAIEAMAFGRPPIVSAIGGLKEVVVDGETGWHVPPGDAPALARRLQFVIENPETWRDFGLAARTRFEAVFSESSVSSAIASVLAQKIAPLTPTSSTGRGSISPATLP